MPSVPVKDFCIVVDPEWVDYVHLYEAGWYRHKKGYVVRNTSNLARREGAKTVEVLHRTVIAAKQGDRYVFANGNPLDCRRDNLVLLANRQEKLRTRSRAVVDTTSGFKGVHRYGKKGGAWRAIVNNKTVGYAPTKQACAVLYNIEAVKRFGYSAVLNDAFSGADRNPVRVSCSTQGCTESVYSSGLCANHYSSYWKGSPKGQALLHRTSAARKEAHGAWRERNKADLRKKGSAYRQANLPRRKAALASWLKANPEKVRALSHRRRARELGAEGSFTGAEWSAILEAYGHRCRYCASPNNITCDHIVPLAKGGTNWPWNLQPLCRTCNSKKRDSLESEYHV